jgi:gliding motility-associated lipoprotein GldH
MVLVAGCDSNRVFEDNKDFVKKSWAINDTVNFEFTISDTTASYNLQCNIRNTIDYPFHNIYVKYSVKDSTQHVVFGNELSKPVGSNLFDEKTGEPNGNSGIGDIYDHRFDLLNNRKFKAGKYLVKLYHDMRVDTLQGVLAAGVRVETVESK